MKYPGKQCPAQHQTMSGGAPLFQAVTSLMILSVSSGFRRSALMWWNRCRPGDSAAPLANCQLAVLDLRTMGSHGDVLDSLLQLRHVLRNDCDVCTLLCEKLGNTSAHALRSASHNNSLCSQRSAEASSLLPRRCLPCPLQGIGSCARRDPYC